MSREFFNYLTGENGAKILECSSYKKNGPCENVLTNDRRVKCFPNKNKTESMAF